MLDSLLACKDDVDVARLAAGDPWYREIVTHTEKAAILSAI